MVVKRSYSKMILREFRHSFSRFLAIFAIIALGVGFLAGLLATPRICGIPWINITAKPT